MKSLYLALFLGSLTLFYLSASWASLALAPVPMPASSLASTQCSPLHLLGRRCVSDACPPHPLLRFNMGKRPLGEKVWEERPQDKQRAQQKAGENWLKNRENNMIKMKKMEKESLSSLRSACYIWDFLNCRNSYKVQNCRWQITTLKAVYFKKGKWSRLLSISPPLCRWQRWSSMVGEQGCDRLGKKGKKSSWA